MKRERNLKQGYNEISGRDKIVFVAVLVLIFSLFQLGIKQICGFTFYPDEFGYWASAAKMEGWNWSEIASLGSYYSFGYSLLLYPVLHFAPDSITAYQAAIFVNMLFMCIGYVLLCMITKRLFANMPTTLRYLASGAAVLYPSWIFYMQVTLTEALLFSLFIIVAYLFIDFIERPRVRTGVLLFAVLIYFYTVHMRTVGTIAACCITLFLWGMVQPQSRKYVFFVLGLVIIAFIGALYIKELVQQSVYVTASTEALATNDYSGQIGSIKYIGTIEGILELISHLAGKIIYWGVASLGLVYWAFTWEICRIAELVQKLKKRQKSKMSEWFAVFLFLTSIAQILISSIFYIRISNLDLYMNGRYIDFLVPVLIMVGIYQLYVTERKWSMTIFFSLVHILLTIITLFPIRKEDTQRIRGYFQIGVNWLLKSNEVDTRVHLLKVACVGVLFLVLVSCLMWIVKKKEIFLWLISLLMLIEIGMASTAGIQYSYYHNNYNYRELVLVDIVQDKCDPRVDIYYLEDGNATWIDFIQMQLRERSIRVITEETWEKQSETVDILFTVNTEENKEKYSAQFDKCVEESLLILFYNTEDERR